MFLRNIQVGRLKKIFRRENPQDSVTDLTQDRCEEVGECQGPGVGKKSMGSGTELLSLTNL